MFTQSKMDQENWTTTTTENNKKFWETICCVLPTLSIEIEKKIQILF